MGFDAYPQVGLRLLFFIPSGDCIEVMVRRTIIAIAPVPPGGRNTPLKKPLRAARVCRRHASAVRTEGRGGGLIEKCKIKILIDAVVNYLARGRMGRNYF